MRTVNTGFNNILDMVRVRSGVRGFFRNSVEGIVIWADLVFPLWERINLISESTESREHLMEIGWLVLYCNRVEEFVPNGGLFKIRLKELNNLFGGTI